MTNKGFIPPHGNYEKLLSYKKSAKNYFFFFLLASYKKDL